MNDLADFLARPDDFYCLQPIMLCPTCVPDEYLLIDGQQRLISLYLLLRLLDDKRTQGLYSITFERDSLRLDVETDLSEVLSDKQAEQSPDRFFMRHAYDTMRRFLDQQPELRSRIAGLLTAETGPYVRIIRYEVYGNENAQIAAFNRINAGRISLSEADLIKGLMVAQDNNCDSEHAMYRAFDWDRMERTLRRPDLWPMLALDSNAYTQHIELITDLTARQIVEADKETYNDLDEKRALFSFLVIDQYIRRAENRQKAVAEVWSRMEQTFNILLSMCDDLDTYHLVGLYSILTQGENRLNVIFRLYELFADNEKSIACRELRSMIGAMIKVDDLAKLNYNDNYDKIVRLLTAFNVRLSMTSTSGARFPFGAFRKFYSGRSKTSLEHIHPQNPEDIASRPLAEVNDWFAQFREINKSNMPSAEELKKYYKSDDRETIWNEFEAARKYADEQLSRINDLADKDKQKKELETAMSMKKMSDCVNELDKMFSAIAGIDEASKHLLSNLALLDRDTNSALSNGVIWQKRDRLSKREAAGQTYVPEGTRAAFNKRFSTPVHDFTFWHPEDRQAYFTEIEKAYTYFTQK